MSSGAQQISHFIRELVPGVTPTTGAWQTARLTGNTLTPAVATEQSEEITDSRIGQGSIATAVNINGDLAGEFSFGTFDSLLAAAFYGDWVADKLTVGATRITHSIAKSFNDVEIYTLFKGAHVASFALDIPGEGKVTTTFSMQCLDYQDQVDTPFVTTALPPTDTPFISALNIGTITADGQSLEGKACVSALTFNLDNTLQTQRCLGSSKLGPGALIATEAVGTGTMTLAWSRDAWTIWKNQFTRKSVAIQFPITDSLGNKYVFDFPALEVDGELPSGGKADLLEIQLNFTVSKKAPIITRIPAPPPGGDNGGE